MNDRRLLELLRAQLLPALELQTIPVEDARSLPPSGTHFGGTPYAESGETWPTCPGCGKGLTFIGQVDAREARLAFGHRVGLFTFFYCWHCMPAGLDGEVAGSWVVRVHPTPEPGRHAPMLPPEGPTLVTRPCMVRLVPMTSHPDWDEVAWRFPELCARALLLAPSEPYAAHRAAVAELLGDPSIATQLGGFARWIQSACRRPCRVCREPLHFVLQIDSLCEADCDWGLSGLAYLLVCPEHPNEWGLVIQRT